MKKFWIMLAVTLLIVSPLFAQIEPGRDTYEAMRVSSITIDGNQDDWADADLLEEVKFKLNATGEFVLFEEYGGGNWTGVEDHSTGVAFAWEPNAFYLGIVVTDDEHENGANSAWNGDAAQIVFEPTGTRDAGAGVLLYNFALGGNGSIVIHNEKIGGAEMDESSVAIVRDDASNTTLYEIRFSPATLNHSAFEAGMKIGVGVCVNDGDSDTPGQKGWSGWGPYAAVYGKSPDQTGLVTLSESSATAVEAKNRLTTTWAEIKK